MNKLSFQWKTNEGKYQSGESLYLNRIRVGGYEWNSSRSRSESKDNAKDYSGSSILPQLNKLVYGQTPEEVKNKVEHQVANWLKEVLRD